ncbi:MAG: tRNA (adenosine(37)-N6)-dimethylallyltransferase MiaA [Candidatus Izemoplasmatales bacterium]
MIPILSIVGPTATGKSEVGIVLAQAFNGEIISADAFQFYRGLDIATAKIPLDAQQSIPHHLLDILDPNDDFSVYQFQKCVHAKIDELRERGKTPILVGGSGLYLKAVLYDYRFIGPKRRDDHPYVRLSNEELYELLRQRAPEASSDIHPNQRRRILRCLEIIDSTGQLNPESDLIPSELHPLIIGLEMERPVLYQRIEKRVDTMLDMGLIAEAHMVYTEYRHTQVAQAIGYKEFFPYFEGDIRLEEAIRLVKQHSRNYAKRQMTWFKNQMDVHWFLRDADQLERSQKQVIDFVKDFYK